MSTFEKMGMRIEIGNSPVIKHINPCGVELRVTSEPAGNNKIIPKLFHNLLLN